MSQYGVEMYADTGFKFVIPDYSGFVFSHYMDFAFAPKQWDDSVFYTQPIPAGAQVVVFTRIIGRNTGTSTNCPTIMYQNLGTQLNFSYINYYLGQESWHTITVRLYFFYNKEVRGDDSQYGLRVFDEAGQIVFHTSSKPLRIQRANWGYIDGWATDVGHGVATLCNRLGQRGFIFQQPPMFGTHINNVIGVGEGTILKAALSYQQTIPSPVEININTNPEIMYINTGYYD